MTTKTALVTGASSGIGEATALKLINLGYTVYGAARRTDRLHKLAESPGAVARRHPALRAGADRLSGCPGGHAAMRRRHAPVGTWTRQPWKNASP
ncbi:hypothetical protein SUDANB105_08029 [Streptomyces sp. enrichment culture]